MEGHPRPGAQPPDLIDRLHDTRLAVDPLDGDQVRPPGEGLPHVVGIDEAAAADGQEHHLCPLAAAPVERGEDGGVLDGGGDDPPAGAGEAAEDGVVGLGGAAGEDDGVGAAAEKGGQGLPGRAQVLAPALAGGVAAGGIAEGRQGVQDRGAHLRQGRGRGVVVEIDLGGRVAQGLVVSRGDGERRLRAKPYPQLGRGASAFSRCGGVALVLY